MVENVLYLDMAGDILGFNYGKVNRAVYVYASTLRRRKMLKENKTQNKKKEKCLFNTNRMVTQFKRHC